MSQVHLCPSPVFTERHNSDLLAAVPVPKKDVSDGAGLVARKAVPAVPVSGSCSVSGPFGTSWLVSVISQKGKR